jgi:MinD superfamily P-loop ATPase
MSQKNRNVICVTGGKGGTGKTVVAINLAMMFKNAGNNVLLIDGDVENPNTYLLLGAELENGEEVPFFIPKLIEEKCSKCGLCAKNCIANALLHIEDQIPIPILTVCSGCKLCYKICPEDAIEPDYKIIGWKYFTQGSGIDILLGELKPSEARSAAVVEALLDELQTMKRSKEDPYDIIILDTAPGAHCDVELLINEADLVIPVTEPTKFGELDLTRIIELIDLLKKEYKTIINRSTLLGFKDEFLALLEEKKIPVLGDIPLDDEVVKSYCQGVPLMRNDAKFDTESPAYIAFSEIFKNLKDWIEEFNNKKDMEE